MFPLVFKMIFSYSISILDNLLIQITFQIFYLITFKNYTSRTVFTAIVITLFGCNINHMGCRRLRVSYWTNIYFDDLRHDFNEIGL